MPFNQNPDARGLGVNTGQQAAPGMEAPTGRGGSGDAPTGLGGGPRPGGPRGPRQPVAPPVAGGAGVADNARTTLDIERDAPIPNRPVIYPVDAVFYRIPISFELEIIGPKPAPNPDATASAQSFSGGVS
jgi:hypothetical protein